MSNRSGTASEIDRERADSQINGSQQENVPAVSSPSSRSQSENQGESENISNEKNPKITNPHWENADGQTITKALVGDEVYLCADVTDINDGATATIKIVEKDDDGNNDDIDSVSGKVQDSKIKAKWKVIYTEDDDDSNSQQEKEEKGYTLPEYAFSVECDGVESDESGQLDVMGWVNIKLSEQDYELLKDFKFYIYTDDWESDDVQFKDKILNFKELPFLINKKWDLGVRL